VFQNRTKEAKEAGEESLKIAREFQNREQIAYTLNDLGSFVYSGLGMYKAALKSLQEANPIWMDLGDLPMLTDNLISTALTLYAGGNYEEALGKTREADGISVPLTLIWAQAYSSGVRGILLVETGRISDSFLEYEHAITKAEQAGFMAGQIIGRTYMSMVNYYLGPQVKSKQLGQDDIAFSIKHIPFWAPQALDCVAYHDAGCQV
jgi:tetratricopeptide (TPR) repeat protein